MIFLGKMEEEKNENKPLVFPGHKEIFLKTIQKIKEGFSRAIEKCANIALLLSKLLLLVPIGTIAYLLLESKAERTEMHEQWLLMRDIFNYYAIIFLILFSFLSLLSKKTKKGSVIFFVLSSCVFYNMSWFFFSLIQDFILGYQ